MNERLIRRSAFDLSEQAAETTSGGEKQPKPPTNGGDADAKAASRTELLISAWRSRQIPPRDYLQGEVFCTTSRWLVYGDTGVGKTLFTMDLAGSMASGNAFLGWEGKRKARVMYLDGEMPDETFKERMILIGDLYGDGIALYGYNRDVLGPDEMPPLDTPRGQQWLMREIDKIKPDVIVFDSIMSLLSGIMAEEESWTKVKLLVRKLSSMHIGQIWLHHTGHDTSHGFGTKTREWEMDTVVSLTKAGEDEARIIIEFKKARLRTPKTVLQFRPRIIERGENGWVEVGDGTVATTATKGGRTEHANIKFALIQGYDQLSDAVEPSSGLAGERVFKVSVEVLREHLKSRGYLDTKPGGSALSTNARSSFHRVKTDLLRSGQFVEGDGMIWRSKRREQ